MPILFSKVGKRLSEILKSHGFKIKYFDEFGDKIYDPESASMFFTDNNMMVTIFDEDDNSSIQLNISEKDNPKDLKKLIDKIRQLANHFGLMFNVQRYTKTLQPKDFATYAVSRVNESANSDISRWVKIFTNLNKIVSGSASDFNNQAQRWVSDNISGTKPSIDPKSQHDYAIVVDELINSMNDDDSVLKEIFNKLLVELNSSNTSVWIEKNKNKFYGLIDMSIKKIQNDAINEDWEDDVAKDADDLDNFMNNIWDAEEIAQTVINKHATENEIDRSNIEFEINEYGTLYGDIENLSDDASLVDTVAEILESKGYTILDAPTFESAKAPINSLNEWIEGFSHDSFIRETKQPLLDKKAALKKSIKVMEEKIAKVQSKKRIAEDKAVSDRAQALIDLSYTLVESKDDDAFVAEQFANLSVEDAKTVLTHIDENWNTNVFESFSKYIREEDEEVCIIQKSDGSIFQYHDGTEILDLGPTLPGAVRALIDRGIRPTHWLSKDNRFLTIPSSIMPISEGKKEDKDFLVVPRTSIGFTKVKGTPKNVDRTKYIESKKVGDRIRITSKHPSGPITYRITRIKPEGIYGIAIPRSSIKETDTEEQEFPDTENGAIAALKYMSDHKVKNPSVKPYPGMYGAWLVTHGTPEERVTSAVYLKGRHNVQNDFEDLDNVYESTLHESTGNFTIDDIKELEKIRDVNVARKRAYELMSNPNSDRPMKPNKLAWLKNQLMNKRTVFDVIKLMYDLMLSGEGNSVIGSTNSMSSNSYRKAFGESDLDEDTFDDLEDHFVGFVEPDHMEKDLVKDIRSTKLERIKKLQDLEESTDPITAKLAEIKKKDIM